MTIIAGIIGIIVGLGGGALGFTIIKERVMKKKLRQVLRKVIKELQVIEADMDKDNLNITINKLKNLATSLGYEFK